MTKDEMIIKWDEQVAMWRRVIDDPLMYTKEDRYKATFYSAAICSMLEDLKKLTLPQVSKCVEPVGEPAVCPSCCSDDIYVLIPSANIYKCSLCDWEWTN